VLLSADQRCARALIDAEGWAPCHGAARSAEHGVSWRKAALPFARCSANTASAYLCIWPSLFPIMHALDCVYKDLIDSGVSYTWRLAAEYEIVCDEVRGGNEWRMYGEAHRWSGTGHP
jgi:hypothetical protein